MEVSDETAQKLQQMQKETEKGNIELSTTVFYFLKFGA